MDEQYLTTAVHNEFARRVEEENDRQNHRISALETAMKDLNRITVSVEKLAVSMDAMANELKKQGSRLDEIEKKPAKRWDVVITGALSAIVGALMAAAMSGLFH